MSLPLPNHLPLTSYSPSPFHLRPAWIMENSTKYVLLIALALLVLLPGKAEAFGAGNIASISAIEGKNWRHGDIEDMLATVACLRGHKWKSMMIKVCASRPLPQLTHTNRHLASILWKLATRLFSGNKTAVYSSILGRLNDLDRQLILRP